MIMSAEGGEWVIINYDYQQVVKLYPECKRLYTLHYITNQLQKLLC